jgi:uncharacterized protein YfaS (alpha-2-macroglobulin family)
MISRVSIAVAILLTGAVFVLGLLNEMPTGSLVGRAVAQETRAPVAARVELVAESVPSGAPERFTATSGEDGRFSFKHVPAGTYTLRIDSGAHHLKGTTVKIREGGVETIEAELAPDKDHLDLYVHQHIFTPDEAPQVTCHGFVLEADYIAFRLFRVDPEKLVTESGGSLRRLLGFGYDDSWTTKDPSLLNNPALVAANTFDSRITSRDREGVFTQRVDFPVLKPGLYVVETRAGTGRSYDWMMVTGLGLVTKTVGPNVLAYTVDLKTGSPVAGVGVKVFAQKESAGTGTTNTEGIANIVTSTTETEGDRTILARNGESFAFVTTWLEGRESASSLIYAYTDRPVYRPGQRVYMKGIVRQRQNEGYVTPTGRGVRLEVKDSRDNLVYRGSSKTDGFGSYYASLDLNPEAATGYYTLTTTLEGASEGQESGFRVMSYRKPEFSVKVTFPKKRYMRGDTVRAKISAQYYFGAPVADAKVNYSVSRSDYWLFGDEEDMYGDYEDYGGYGENVTEGEIRTDENGEAEVEFTADWPKPEKQNPYDTDQMFSVDAYVSDQSDQSADGAGSVLATRGEFAIEVTPDKYVVEPGGEITADILVRDYDHKPVADQRVDISVGTEDWGVVGESRLAVFQRSTVTTDREGHASIKLKAREGSLRIDAAARDSRGNTVTQSGYVWCWGGGYGEMAGARYSDLQIVLDKKMYDPGDTATVLINTAKPGATALVTVEGDRVYFTKTVELKGNSTTVRIPIKSEYKPNFFVGVCYVKNKKFANQEARAKVSLKAQELKIRVKPNKRKYKPGEEAVYDLLATDDSGNPAVAQLSVGVVDEAIYAIARDDTEPILDFFYSRRPNAVSTNFSFPQIYLSDPDKAGSPKLKADQIKVRKRFKDTAFWSPNVVTDANGRATVRFRMPDNLTSWRATVRGITKGATCGQTTRNVLAQQDMLVRLETPRFLVQSDQTTITAAVHNYTERNQSVDVSLSAPGLTIDGGKDRRVSVAKDGVERIDWRVKASKPGDFTVKVIAKGETAGDAMQISLPVHPHGLQRETLEVGRIDQAQRAEKDAFVYEDAIPEATRFNIRLAPSLASSMLASLDYLAQYPWGCTEQTTSSFLPDVVLSQSFKGMGVVNPELEKKLPDMVMKGLYRLYRFELEDGGWSWCQYGKADPWMTAYVCYGLIRARDAGFPVNPEVLKRGMEQLGKLIGTVNSINNKNAYACYVFTLAGWDSSPYFIRAVNEGTLNDSNLAYAALSLVRTGHKDVAAAAMARLYQRAKQQGGMVYWPSGRWDGETVETTAIALEAAVAVDAQDQRVPQIVRWLMRQRTGNYWWSTRQTAEVIYAMSEYLKRSNELAPDCSVVVRVNGRKVGSFRFDKSSIFDLDKVISVPAGLLHRGANEVEIAKLGNGNVYYSLEMTQYLAQKKIHPTTSGPELFVIRAYYQSSRVTTFDENQKLGPAISQCDVGDIVLVRLRVHANGRMRYLLLEDYIPAGFEIVDKGDVDYWDWDYWFSGRDIRDDRIAFFLEEVPNGWSSVEYRMRAAFPGAYHSLPARVFDMYQPSLFAASAESEFTIR